MRLHADAAGAVGIWQVARQAGASFSEFPAVTIGLFSLAPALRPPARQYKPGNVTGAAPRQKP